MSILSDASQRSGHNSEYASLFVPYGLMAQHFLERQDNDQKDHQLTNDEETEFLEPDTIRQAD